MFLRLYPTEKLLYLPFELDALRTRFGISNDNYANPNPTRFKMTLSPKSLAGPGYIILNAIRVMNIIAFMAVIAASIVMLVKISTDTKLYFFDAVSHVVTAISSIFLITSELSLFRSYFATNWPLLSPRSGFVFLALTMIILGINVMGNLNKPSGSQENLGLAFWRIVIASGVVTFILGWVNLIASYVFRDRANGTTARQVRAKGASVHKTPIVGGSFHGSSSVTTPPMRSKSYTSPTTTSSGVRKSFNPFTFNNNNNNQTSPVNRDSWLPSYHTASRTHDHLPSRSTSSSSTSSNAKPYVSTHQNTSKENGPVSPTSRYSRATACTKKKLLGGWRSSLAPPLPVNPQHRGEGEMQISAPMGVNPQFAHLVNGHGASGGAVGMPDVRRPDSALHPSRGGMGEAFRWRV